MGAVIAHVIPDNTEWPTAYASRTLSSPDSNYVQIEKEVLTVVFGVMNFHKFLYGYNFFLETDRNLC